MLTYSNRDIMQGEQGEKSEEELAEGGPAPLGP